MSVDTAILGSKTRLYVAWGEMSKGAALCVVDFAPDTSTIFDVAWQVYRRFRVCSVFPNVHTPTPVGLRRCDCAETDKPGEPVVEWLAQREPKRGDVSGSIAADGDEKENFTICSSTRRRALTLAATASPARTRCSSIRRATTITCYRAVRRRAVPGRAGYCIVVDERQRHHRQ